MIRLALSLSAAAIALLAAACGEPAPPDASPYAAHDAQPARETEVMVAAADPRAVEAGLDVLEAGGDAVDAAIAVQAVLGLVEPQSSGIGGGAFMLRYDASTGEVTVYDGRETAPAGADETLFLDGAGEPLDFLEAWVSGKSVGTPGVIAMLAMAHDEHGALPWASGFDAAIAHAETGFAIAPRLAEAIDRIRQFSPLDEREATAAYFYAPDGEPLPEGHVLTNPAYAETLRAIAADWRNFYTGEIAQGMVEAAAAEPNPGALSLSDLDSYTPLKREAICQPYRDWTLCSAPPPSSGAVATNVILRLLERFDMAANGPDTVLGWHLFTEASRLAYADRDRYVGDPAFADVPTAGLTDAGYIAERAALIDPASAIERVTHGTPPGAPEAAEDGTNDQPGTSHFSIIDADGDVVSMTTTIESAFGAHRMTGGFLLNNELTDFAFEPFDAEGRLRANAPAAGKRPRSSMSPTIVLDEGGRFVAATGSPGGNSIVAYTAKSLLGLLDWQLSAQQAADLPSLVARGDVARVEPGLFDPAIIEGLEALGHDVQESSRVSSRIHTILRRPDGTLEGGADRNGDGVAMSRRVQPQD
jgi:gamma-glutamyltranspeptidase/glutathione hydrolase